MGYLTTITIYNDAFHVFKEDPEGFGKAIIEGIGSAQSEGGQVSVPFGGYANYISVEPPRHADDHTVYVHFGNGIFNLNPWNKDFEEMVSRDPESAAKHVKVAQRILDDAKEKIREEQKLRKKKLKELSKFVPSKNLNDEP